MRLRKNFPCAGEKRRRSCAFVLPFIPVGINFPACGKNALANALLSPARKTINQALTHAGKDLPDEQDGARRRNRHYVVPKSAGAHALLSPARIWNPINPI